MKVPSTQQCLPIGSWVGLVRLGHAIGWRKALFLLDTSIPLRGTSNGWRMTWSGLWRMKKLMWRLARKKGRLSDHFDGPHVLLFCTFMIVMFLFLNLIKDWNVLKPLWKQSFHLLIWAIRESIFFYYYLCLLSFIPFFFFLFFFLCYVIFAQDVPLGIFVIPMVFSPNFCLDCPFRFSIQRDSLALTFI